MMELQSSPRIRTSRATQKDQLALTVWSEGDGSLFWGG